MHNNFNLDLVNINAYSKFGQIPSICSQDILSGKEVGITAWWTTWKQYFDLSPVVYPHQYIPSIAISSNKELTVGTGETLRSMSFSAGRPSGVNVCGSSLGFFIAAAGVRRLVDSRFPRAIFLSADSDPALGPRANKSPGGGIPVGEKKTSIIPKWDKISYTGINTATSTTSDWQQTDQHCCNYSMSLHKKTCLWGLPLDKKNSGYPQDGRADKNPYPHDRRADKDSYPHDSNNQCIIHRLQLSFVMINVQLMFV